MEKEQRVILCDIPPVPRTLPGTTITSPFFVNLSILLILIVLLADDGFNASSASLDQIGALFFLEASFSSFAICNTTALVICIIAIFNPNIMYAQLECRNYLSKTL